MKIYRNLIILFLFLGLYFACGRNPTEPPVKPDVRTIRGNARLENQTDHYGIFVYLEELNQYAFTDENGDYTLTLADSLFSGDGLMKFGQFHLYYSFSCYHFDSTQLILDRNGFVFGQYNLDREGQIKAVKLKQFAKIKTTTDKKVYTPKDSIWVNLTMINCSPFPLTIISGQRLLILFDNKIFWYVFIPPGSPMMASIMSGDSLSYYGFFPCASILEPDWGITLPWHCRVFLASFIITGEVLQVPKPLDGIVKESGWFWYGPKTHYLNLPITDFNRQMRKSFNLAEIIIVPE
jgi:hypothetical protein